MIEPILLDAGPLVASIDRRDYFHKWAVAQLTHLRLPVLTCEAVLSEACFLLRQVAGGPHAVIELVNKGAVEVAFRFADEARAVGRLHLRYQSVSMSFADACLVRMAELFTGSSVMTTDGDFTIYRKHGSQLIPTIMPPKR